MITPKTSTGRVRQLRALTDEQCAMMPAHTAEWISIGHSTAPANHAAGEDAIRRCYEAAGLPTVPIFWVPSPLVGALAAPIAVRLISGPGSIDSAVHSVVRSAVDSAVYSAVHSAVYSAVHSAVHSVVRSAVDSAVYSAVHSAVYSAVHSAVDSAVHSAIRSAVDSAVRSAVDSAVYSVVDSAVYSAVYSAVHSVVRSAVRSAVGAWHPWMGGQYWTAEVAYTSFFRERAGLTLGPKLDAAARAYEDASRHCGYWWPNQDFCLVSERPVQLHVRPVGRGRWQLHAAGGPAIAWADGYAIHYWRGLRVPAWAVEHPTPERIAAEQDTEIRRAAIEAYGWPEYLAALGAAPVDTTPDPANPGHHLHLYDLPDAAQVYGAPVRLLVMDNASRDRDGSRRSYAETVPTTCETALAAAAWQFGQPPATYASLQRAT